MLRQALTAPRSSVIDDGLGGAAKTIQTGDANVQIVDDR